MVYSSFIFATTLKSTSSSGLLISNIAELGIVERKIKMLS